MQKTLRLMMVAAGALALAGCGQVHSKVTVAPENLGSVQQVVLLPAEVVSKEKNPDAMKLNEQWKGLAAEELQKVLGAKNVKVAAGSKLSVRPRINVTYGNQAARMFVGYGAGAGRVSVTVELQDESGKVRYATNSEADLASGSAMAEVVRNAIRAAATDFASRL